MEDDPLHSLFILEAALACNRDLDFDLDGTHRLCTEDSDEACTHVVVVEPRVRNILIAENDLSHSTTNPVGGGHSQGIYAARTYDMVIRENVIYHNGWYLDRSGSLPGSRAATIFDHNVYLQSGSGPAVLANNIIADASSHGAQMRSGGIATGNLFAQNPLGMFVGGNATGELKYELSEVAYNIFSQGNDINSSNDRGFSVDSNNAPFSEIHHNIISHLHPSSGVSNNHGPRVVCSEVPTEPCTVNVRENFIYRWSRPDGAGTTNSLVILDDGIALTPGDLITMVDNTIIEPQVLSGNQRLVHLDRGPGLLANHILFSANRYVAPQATTRMLFRSPTESFSGLQWQATKEPDAALAESLSLPDPCRTVASYQFVVVEGGDPGQACQVMHDDLLFARFMEAARAHTNRFADRSLYRAAAVNRWIAQGFGLAWPDE